MNDEVLLRAEGLVPSGVAVTQPLDLALAGGLVVLVGPDRDASGIWLRTLAGLIPPASGALYLLGRSLDGEDAHHWQRLRRRVGFVSPQAPLLSIMSGLRNVMLPALYHRMGREHEIEKKARAVLGEMIYDADHDLLPAFMTELQRRHLLIVRALMLEPRILMLDQPLTGLGMAERELLRDYLSDRLRPRVSLLLVAADDPLLARLADIVLFIGRQEAYLFTGWTRLLNSNVQEVLDYLESERRAGAALG